MPTSSTGTVHARIAFTARHFWLGAATRPYLPAPLADLGARALNRPAVRRAALPKGLQPALARHCAEEYANLATLLPELYGRYA